MKNCRIYVFFGLVLALIALVGGDCLAAEGGNIFDSVVTNVENEAKTWAVMLRKMALQLFWILAVISFIWNLGRQVFNQYEINGFFDFFVRFIIVTGTWLFVLTNGPEIMHAIIDTFLKMGYDGGAQEIAPGVVMKDGLNAFGVVVSYIRFPSISDSIWSAIWSGGDESKVIGDYMPGFMAYFIAFLMLACAAILACALAIQMIKAYILVYGGYFYIAFASCDWTRPMARNYIYSIFVAGAELFAMLATYSAFGELYSMLVANFVNAAVFADEGIKLRECIIILCTMIMMVYFICSIPSVFGRVMRGVSTGVIGPVSQRQVRRMADIASGGGTRLARLAMKMSVKGGSKAAQAIKGLRRR